MSISKLIADSKPSSGGVYLVPGLYPVLNICDFKIQNSRKGDTLVIAEFEILESETSERPAGTKASQVWNLSKHDAAPGNVKAFVAAVLGGKDEDIGEEVMDQVFDEGLLVGQGVRCQATNIKTKAGGDFTKTDFFTLSEEVSANLEAMRAEQGFAAAS